MMPQCSRTWSDFAVVTSSVGLLSVSLSRAPRGRAGARQPRPGRGWDGRVTPHLSHCLPLPGDPSLVFLSPPSPFARGSTCRMKEENLILGALTCWALNIRAQSVPGYRPCWVSICGEGPWPQQSCGSCAGQAGVSAWSSLDTAQHIWAASLPQSRTLASPRRGEALGPLVRCPKSWGEGGGDGLGVRGCPLVSP